MLMRAPALLLLIASTLAIARASDSATPPRTPMQEALRQQLPKFDAARAATPAPPPQPRTANTEARQEDGIVFLPDYQVVEKKEFGPRDDEWLTVKGANAAAVRRLEARSNALELALNRWHIPLLTPSFAARARAAYDAERTAEENDRLQHIIDVSRHQ